MKRASFLQRAIADEQRSQTGWIGGHSDRVILTRALCLLLLGFLPVGCRPPSFVSCSSCTITHDCDGDQLSNEDEVHLGTDPCKDDSDGDGINDFKEVSAGKICLPAAGAFEWRACLEDSECPTGHCIGFDPLDQDQDRDGMPDGEEDRNLDGIVGTCSTLCADTTSCASGQRCEQGRCVSGPLPQCMGVETDPRLADSDGDGVNDGQDLSTRLCQSWRDTRSTVFKSIEGDWQLFLDPGFRVTPVSPMDSTALSARTIAHENGQVVGFILARKPTHEAFEYQIQADEKLLSEVPGVQVDRIHSDGPHDQRGELIRFRLLQVTLAQEHERSAATLRNQLLAMLSGYSVGELQPESLGDPTPKSQLLLMLTEVWRKDSVISLVSLVSLEFMLSTTMPHSPLKLAYELANATGLAHLDDQVSPGCEHIQIQRETKADIVIIARPISSIPDGEKIRDMARFIVEQLGQSYLKYRVGVLHGCQDEMNLVGGGFSSDPAEIVRRLELPNESCYAKAPLSAGKSFYEKLHSPDASNSTAPMLDPEARLLFLVIADEDEEMSSDTFEELFNFYLNHDINIAGLTITPQCASATYAETTNINEMIKRRQGTALPLCTSPLQLKLALFALTTYMMSINSPLTLSALPIASSLRVAVKGPAHGPGTTLESLFRGGFFFMGPEPSVLLTVGLHSSSAPKLDDSLFVYYERVLTPAEIGPPIE